MSNNRSKVAVDKSSELKLHKELDYVRRYLGRVRTYLDSDMTAFSPPTCTRINSYVSDAQSGVVSHVQQRLEEERFIRREMFMAAQRERRFLEEEDALGRARRLLKLEDTVFRLNVAEVVAAEKASCDLLFREAESIAQARKVQIRRSAVLDERDKLGHLAQVCREEEILKDRILREIGLSRPMMQDLCCSVSVDVPNSKFPTTEDDSNCNEQQQDDNEKVIKALVYGDLKDKTVELTQRGVYRANFRAHKVKEARQSSLDTKNKSENHEMDAREKEYNRILEEKLRALRPPETAEEQQRAVLQTISVLISSAINTARKAGGVTYSQYESGLLLNRERVNDYLKKKRELLGKTKKIMTLPIPQTATNQSSTSMSEAIMSSKLNAIIASRSITDKLNDLVIENEVKKSTLGRTLPLGCNVANLTSSLLNESINLRANDNGLENISNSIAESVSKRTNSPLCTSQSHHSLCNNNNTSLYSNGNSYLEPSINVMTYPVPEHQQQYDRVATSTPKSVSNIAVKTVGGENLSSLANAAIAAPSSSVRRNFSLFNNNASIGEYSNISNNNGTLTVNTKSQQQNEVVTDTGSNSIARKPRPDANMSSLMSADLPDMYGHGQDHFGVVAQYDSVYSGVVNSEKVAAPNMSPVAASTYSGQRNRPVEPESPKRESMIGNNYYSNKVDRVSGSRRVPSQKIDASSRSNFYSGRSTSPLPLLASAGASNGRSLQLQLTPKLQQQPIAVTNDQADIAEQQKNGNYSNLSYMNTSNAVAPQGNKNVPSDSFSIGAFGDLLSANNPVKEHPQTPSEAIAAAIIGSAPQKTTGTSQDITDSARLANEILAFWG